MSGGIIDDSEGTMTVHRARSARPGEPEGDAPAPRLPGAAVPDWVDDAPGPHGTGTQRVDSAAALGAFYAYQMAMSALERG